jgi:hypothetical protein
MYPLNMQLADPDVGFAVANDSTEHASLNAAGYLPLLEAADPQAVIVPAAEPTRDELIAVAVSRGIKIDGRWSYARIAAELAK